MNDCLLGVVLGLIAGAYIVSRCKGVQDFINDTDKAVRKTADKAEKVVKNAVKEIKKA